MSVGACVLGRGGVDIYKTKGTVLFSWCGSGSIMPLKDQERKTEIRKGSFALWQRSDRANIQREFFLFFFKLCAHKLLTN